MLEVHSLRRQLEGRKGIEATLLGKSPAMQGFGASYWMLRTTGADVLIYGDTGQGKEMFCALPA